MRQEVITPDEPLFQLEQKPLSDGHRPTKSGNGVFDGVRVAVSEVPEVAD
jgi:hypothetical protein